MKSSPLDDVAYALLFDRLVDLDRMTPREPRPLRTLDRQGLYDSVRREVEQLLNTRCSLTLGQMADRDLTVLDYGASDLSFVSPIGPEDQRLIALVLTRAITSFEPRLQRVRVTVDRFEPHHTCLYVTVNAVLRGERLAEPVSFPVVVRTALHAGPEAPAGVGR